MDLRLTAKNPLIWECTHCHTPVEIRGRSWYCPNPNCPYFKPEKEDEGVWRCTRCNRTVPVEPRIASYFKWEEKKNVDQITICPTCKGNLSKIDGLTELVCINAGCPIGAKNAISASVFSVPEIKTDVEGTVKPLESSTDMVERMIKEKQAETGKAETVDIVNSPPHYKTEAGIEVIDVIKAFSLNFCRGNVVKYILRAGRKDQKKELEDLKKARWYLDREIMEREGRTP